MELRHLRYFVGVAETGSLSRAAEKLFIAQPPLSLQIRQLEEELGVALFTRHPKGVRLTAAGQALLPEARALLDRAARVVDVARQADHGSGPGGTLRLGFVPSTSSTVLPTLVRQLRLACPRVQLELREMISDEQTDALVNGHLDAGIARTPSRHPRLSVACDMPDPFCLAVPLARAPVLSPARERRLARLPAKTAPQPAPVAQLSHYADHDFVGFTRHRGPAYFDQSIHLCARAGFSPRIRYEASTVHGVLDLVSAELGVALVPRSTRLLAVAGVSFLALDPRGGVGGAMGVMSLLRRKTDPNPLLVTLQAVVTTLFTQLEERLLDQD